MGYTLPVFACASAIAALVYLQENNSSNFKKLDSVKVDLLKPAQIVEIPIEQLAKLSEGSALAITRSDPGKHLDITRHTPIWALVTQEKSDLANTELEIIGGEGIGRQTQSSDRAAIYKYAQKLLRHNLQPFLKPGFKVTVMIILPEGKQLALKTSNAAFGVVEGLSLLGTTGIVQPLTAPSQLTAYQQELELKAKSYDSLVFCLGENGLNLAAKLGINPAQIVKTANWLGSMLVAAASYGVKSILLLGYHGKLIKLAGGIWHTHHHLADGRLEILASFCARYGLNTMIIKQVIDSPTTEAALKLIRAWDTEHQSDWERLIYSGIVETIDQRSQTYISKHTDMSVTVGSILFDRQQSIFVQSNHGKQMFCSFIE